MLVAQAGELPNALDRDSPPKVRCASELEELGLSKLKRWRNLHRTIPSAHDLLGSRALRTDGGIAESHARFIPSYRLNDTYAERATRGGLRNFYIFDFAVNGVVI